MHIQCALAAPAAELSPLSVMWRLRFDNGIGCCSLFPSLANNYQITLRLHFSSNFVFRSDFWKMGEITFFIVERAD